MRKTSVYLDDTDRERLAVIAEREGKSQAEIIRAAILAYASQPPTRREFALACSAKGWRGGQPPTSTDPQAYQDFIDGLMEGFGTEESCADNSP